MTNSISSPRLFTVDAVRDAAEGCIDAQMSPARAQSAQITARFCDVNEVEVVRGAGRLKGYVGYAVGENGQGELTPATVALKVSIKGRAPDGGLQIMAPPRPMIMYVPPGTPVIEASVAAAARDGAAMILVLSSSAKIADAVPVDRETALRLLGMTTTKN